MEPPPPRRQPLPGPPDDLDTDDRIADLAEHAFAPPSRCVFTPDDLQALAQSDARRILSRFVRRLSRSVEGVSMASKDLHVSPAVEAILAELAALNTALDETPPIEQPMRFGNKAFRDWMDKVRGRTEAFHAALLPEGKLREAADEVAAYWNESFGNRTRLDYGTGHELNFVVWLLCLYRIGFLEEADLPAAVLRVFVAYLRLVRRLQTEYWLEPAGSRGVWGLDEYQILAFYFGAAQLVGHTRIKPKSIHSDDILEYFSKDFLYLDCIQHIQRVKKGIFAEHSPILNDISGLVSWHKANSGLYKMFVGEVLEKLPVIQHLVFGTILPLATPSTRRAAAMGVPATELYSKAAERAPPGGAMPDVAVGRMPPPDMMPPAGGRMPAPDMMPPAGGRMPAPDMMPPTGGRMPPPDMMPPTGVAPWAKR